MNSNIILGQIGLSFHRASAGVFHRVLDYWGYRVDFITDVHENIFKKQEQGEIDLLLSAWLPGSHGDYLRPYEARVTKFVSIYTPYCVWAVPDYVDPHLVSSIDDLNTPQVLSKIEKDINGIGMGAGISRFSVEMLGQYGLEPNGYRFISNAFDDFTALVEEKIKNQMWFVIPLWYPQFLHQMFPLRPLREPKGLLRGKDEATPIFLNTSKAKIDPKHLEIISRITLGNEAITAIDYAFSKSSKTAHEAAEEWMTKTYGSVAAFIAQL